LLSTVDNSDRKLLTRFREELRVLDRDLRLFSNGVIFSATFEKAMLAFTHSAKGAAQTDALLITEGSNDSAFSRNILSTDSLIVKIAFKNTG
jgi:hypothetical protein